MGNQFHYPETALPNELANGLAQKGVDLTCFQSLQQPEETGCLPDA